MLQGLGLLGLGLYMSGLRGFRVYRALRVMGLRASVRVYPKLRPQNLKAPSPKP